MAINNTTGILSSAEQAQLNYEQHKDKYVDATEDLVNSETFMQLLVAEMTNQDPLEPTSNTEFISQLATFSQMQYMRDASTYSMATYASSLVGKTATATKMDGKNLISKTGVVESVTFNKSTNSYTVKIDGESFDLSKVTAVSETKTDETVDGTDMQNALGDSIARAASMVGMYAYVSKEENGVITKDEGFITAVTVKDGVISAVINEKTYALSDITEVTYAMVVDDTENAEGTVPGENAPESGEVGGVDSEDAAESGAVGGVDSEDAAESGAVGGADSEESAQQDVIRAVDEDVVLQTGAITPDYVENDVADVVDEAEPVQAVQQAGRADDAETELIYKLIEALESGADIETVLKIAGEIPEDQVITNPHPTGITPVSPGISAPSSAGISSVELSNEKVESESAIEGAMKTETATRNTSSDEEDRLLAQRILDAMAQGADLETLLRMGGLIPETDEES